MVPDKIYTDNRGVYAELPVFSQADANVAYIRKDALLEFLDGLEKDSARNARTDDLAFAAHDMVCLIIDKIELL